MTDSESTLAFDDLEIWVRLGCTRAERADPQAVVDELGKVHGTDNIYVADASVIPTIPRANTNLPTLVIAERIVECLR